MQQRIQWLTAHWRGVVLFLAFVAALGLAGSWDMKDYCARPEVVCSR